MLGEQFNLTYWHGKDGSPIYVGPRDDRNMYHNKGGAVGFWARPTKSRGSWDEGIDPQELPHQGMLFSPWVGTGVGKDPALGPDHQDAIDRALKLDDTTKYPKIFGRTPEDVPGDVKELRHGVTRTSIPRSVIDSLSVRTGITGRPGRSYATNYQINILNDQRGQPDIAALPHELGHAQDDNMSDDLSQNQEWIKNTKDGGYQWQGARADPRDEGVADGFADRYTRLASTMSTPEGIAESHKTTGYSTEFSGFKGQTSKALYSAIRAHGITADHAVRSLPGRSALVRDAGITGSLDPLGVSKVATLKRSGKGRISRSEYVTHERINAGELIASGVPDKLMLGYMAHRHPHVQGVLEAQGYGKAMNESLGLFREKFPPVPHDVALKTGDDARISRQQFGKERHARALERWQQATDSDRPNTQTETLF